MITERHNLACRMNFKAISKTGPLGSCIASKDIGSNERMAMQNLQIPETAESRIVPKWLFPPRFPDKDRFTSSRPDIVLVTPTSAKTRKQQTTAGGWVLRSGRGQLRETGSTPAAPPATSRAINLSFMPTASPPFFTRTGHLLDRVENWPARPVAQRYYSQLIYKGARALEVQHNCASVGVAVDFVLHVEVYPGTADSTASRPPRPRGS
jgi:hypothetical protein